PKRAQDYCLPVRANRRLPTTIHFSGLNHAAYLLATPGFVRPLTGRHAGSLLTGWLDVNQVGFAHGTHPLGNNNQFHEFSPNAKVSVLPWREHALVLVVEVGALRDDKAILDRIVERREFMSVDVVKVLPPTDIRGRAQLLLKVEFA